MKVWGIFIGYSLEVETCQFSVRQSIRMLRRVWAKSKGTIPHGKHSLRRFIVVWMSKLAPSWMKLIGPCRRVCKLGAQDHISATEVSHFVHTGHPVKKKNGCPKFEHQISSVCVCTCACVYAHEHMGVWKLHVLWTMDPHSWMARFHPGWVDFSSRDPFGKITCALVCHSPHHSLLFLLLYPPPFPVYVLCQYLCWGPFFTRCSLLEVISMSKWPLA